MAASLSDERTLRFVERTQGQPGLCSTEFEVNVALPKSLFCFLGGAFSFSTSSGLGALAMWIFPENMQCSGQAQLLE